MEKKKESKAKHVLGLFAANNQFPIHLQAPSSLMLLQNATYGFTAFRKFNEVYISYCFNLKKNFFLDAGMRYTTVFHGYEANEWLVWNEGFLADFQSAYRIISMNIGGGYKIITNSGIKLFDFLGGTTLGLLDNPVGAGNHHHKYLTTLMQITTQEL